MSHRWVLVGLVAVVISIAGVLAVVVARLPGPIHYARTQRCVALMQGVCVAVQRYRQNHSGKIPTIEQLVQEQNILVDGLVEDNNNDITHPGDRCVAEVYHA